MNPKIWLYFYSLGRSPLGLPIEKLVLKLENNLNCTSLLYIEGTNPEPYKDTISLEEFCGIISIYTGIPFIIGTERLNIFNSRTHQKVLGLDLVIPECLAIIDYEDFPVRFNFSNMTEGFLRENFINGLENKS